MASTSADVAEATTSVFSLKSRKQSCEAAIFDMDGLMIDTEPFWRKAQIEEFAKVGIELTEDNCVETTGTRIDDIAKIRFEQKPWDESALGISRADIADMVVNKVRDFILESGEPKEGLKEVIEFLSTKVSKMAIASSSSPVLIAATLERLKDVIRTDVFTVTVSAHKMEFGKPHPKVYLDAMKQLGVSETGACLVFEDSLTGTLSAKAASMRAVAIPEDFPAQTPKFAIADVVLASLKDFNEDVFSSIFSS